MMPSTFSEGKNDLSLGCSIILTINIDCSLGFHCPVSYNPADYFIKILSQAENKIALTESDESQEDLFHPFETIKSERTIDSFIVKQCQKYAADFAHF